MTRAEHRALRHLIPALRDHATSEAPNECVGLIEWDGTALTLIRLQNVAGEPRTSFLVDPDEQVAALKGIESRGTEFWGILHSHPSEGAHPSELDRRFAENLPVHWLIVGLEPGDGDLELFVGHPRNDDGAAGVRPDDAI